MLKRHARMYERKVAVNERLRRETIAEKIARGKYEDFS